MLHITVALQVDNRWLHALGQIKHVDSFNVSFASVYFLLLVVESLDDLGPGARL